jgi:hypothetical protein
VNIRAVELDCERTIIAAAKLLGYRVHGERAAFSRSKFSTPIKGDAGWPDLVIAGHGHLYAIELKRKPNKVSDEQTAWLEALTDAGFDARVIWVPEGQQAFIDELTAAARRKVAP